MQELHQIYNYFLSHAVFEKIWENSMLPLPPTLTPGQLTPLPWGNIGYATENIQWMDLLFSLKISIKWFKTVHLCIRNFALNVPRKYSFRICLNMVLFPEIWIFQNGVKYGQLRWFLTVIIISFLFSSMW